MTRKEIAELIIYKVLDEQEEQRRFFLMPIRRKGVYMSRKYIIQDLLKEGIDVKKDVISTALMSYISVEKHEGSIKMCFLTDSEKNIINYYSCININATTPRAFIREQLEKGQAIEVKSGDRNSQTKSKARCTSRAMQNMRVNYIIMARQDLL